MTTDTTDVDAQLDALAEQIATTAAAATEARTDLAEAKAARGDAVADGTLEDSHSARVIAARERLEVCTETEHALIRRRRTLSNETPAVSSAAGDSRTVRVTITGTPGRHACNLPSSGRRLMGGDDLTVTADDALTLAAGGYVRTVGKLPDWWPHGVPIPDESTLYAISGAPGSGGRPRTP